MIVCINFGAVWQVGQGFLTSRINLITHILILGVLVP
jgi:hypothetical protein